MSQTEPAVAVVAYIIGAREISALWIGPDGASKYSRVGSVAEFLPRVEQLQDELHDPMAIACGQVPCLQRFVSEWGAELLPETVFSTEPDVLVIVPNGFLHDLPLHIVNNPSSGAPLCWGTGVSYASSASMLEQCQLRNRHRAGKGFSDAGARAIFGRAADVITGDNAPFLVPVSGLKRHFKHVDVSDDEFTTSRLGVKGGLHNATDVICIAAHGYLDPIRGDLSGIILPAWESGWADRGIDVGGGVSIRYRDLPFTDLPPDLHTAVAAEILTGAELEVEPAIDADLVVLVACSAGSGLVREGDQPASIGEMFLRLGAVSVLAPGWSVDANLSARFVDCFMADWIETNHSKAAAHSAAVRAVSAEGWGGRPECFGAFTVRGDWL